MGCPVFVGVGKMMGRFAVAVGKVFSRFFAYNLAQSTTWLIWCKFC